MDAVTVINVRASEFITHAFLFIAIPDHLKPCLAHGDAIPTDGISVFVFEVHASPFIQVNDGGNGIPLAELL